MAFVFELRVRYVECDMQGVVFNSHYLTWFDQAYTEMLREAYGPYAKLLEEQGVEWVVAEANVRYRRPARFDDEVAIVLELDEPGTSSLTTHCIVRRGDEVLTEGRLVHVCVDAQTFEKTAWPPALRDAFRPFVRA